MIKIKRIELMPLAKMLCFIQAFVGLITGIFLSFIALLDPGFLETQVGPPGSIFGIFSFIMVPLINAIVGFISGIVIAWTYNLIAQYIGGIVIELENPSD